MWWRWLKERRIPGLTVEKQSEKLNKRCNLFSNLSVFKGASDMTLSQHPGGQISLWLLQEFEQGQSQLQDDFSITGPAAFGDAAVEQTSASPIETAPRVSVQMVLNSLNSKVLPPVLHFPSCSAEHWRFYIQVLWIIQQSQHNQTGTSQRVKVLHGKGQTGWSDCCCKSTFEDIWIFGIFDIWKLPFFNFKYYNIGIMFLITHLFAQNTIFSLSQHHKFEWIRASLLGSI